MAVLAGIFSLSVLLIILPFQLFPTVLPKAQDESTTSLTGDPFNTGISALSSSAIESLAKIETPPDFNWRQYEGLTLNFIVENNLNANILTKEVSNFTAATGITVNIRTMDYDTMVEKISMDLISRRNKYQLIYVDPYQTLNRFHNQLYDLNQLNNDPDLPHIPGGLDDFFPDQLNVVSYFGNRDKLLTIPFDTTTMILFYRKDIFDRYKADFMADKGYDWTPGSTDFTWERYIEVSQWIDENVPDELVRYGSGQMAQAHNAIYCEFSNILSAYGGDYFGDLHVNGLGIHSPRQLLMDRPAFIQSLEIYKKAVQVAAPDSIDWNWDDLAQSFMQGDIAMMTNWDENWAAVENPEISEVSGQVGYSILPYGSIRSANIYGGSGIGINPYASQQEKEAAWLFIIWATSPRTELMAFLEPEGGNVPPRISLNSPALMADIMAEVRGIDRSDKLILQFPAVISAWNKFHIYYRPKVENFTDIEPVIIHELHQMIVDDTDPAQTADNMMQQISSIR